MIFLIGNLKGGVGKTTLAVNLAITLSNSHRDVLLIDAEGSAIDLTELRANARGTAGYTAVNLQGANIRTQARQLAHKYSDIVIDIGGEDATGSLRAALIVADTVLVPVKPRTLDLWRTRQTAELIIEAREINETLRAVAVLNEADPAGQDNQETLDALAEIPAYEIAPVTLGRRKAIPNALAAGLSVLEYHQDPKAADEMCQLFKFLAPYTVNTSDIGETSYGNR
jgi:chromosome partitioning protein